MLLCCEGPTWAPSVPSYPRSQFLGSSVRNTVHQKGTLLLSLLFFLFPDLVLGSKFVHQFPCIWMKLTWGIASEFCCFQCHLFTIQTCKLRSSSTVCGKIPYHTGTELFPKGTKCDTVGLTIVIIIFSFLLQHVSLTCSFLFSPFCVSVRQRQWSRRKGRKGNLYGSETILLDFLHSLIANNLLFIKSFFLDWSKGTLHKETALFPLIWFWNRPPRDEYSNDYSGGYAVHPQAQWCCVWVVCEH